MQGSRRRRLRRGCGRRFAPSFAPTPALPARLPTNCPAASLRSSQDSSPNKQNAANWTASEPSAAVILYSLFLLSAFGGQECPPHTAVVVFAPCGAVRPESSIESCFFNAGLEGLLHPLTLSVKSSLIPLRRGRFWRTTQRMLPRVVRRCGLFAAFVFLFCIFSIACSKHERGCNKSRRRSQTCRRSRIRRA